MGQTLNVENTTVPVLALAQKDMKAILIVHKDVGENAKAMTTVPQFWLALDSNASIPVLERVEKWLNVLSKITSRYALVREVTLVILSSSVKKYLCNVSTQLQHDVSRNTKFPCKLYRRIIILSDNNNLLLFFSGSSAKSM